MKFTTVLLALMAASTAFAAPHNLQRAAKGTKAVAAAKPCDKGNAAAAAATAAKSSKGSKSSKNNAGSSNNAASSSNSTSSVDSSSNSTSTDDSSSSDNSTSSSGATSTSTAASATRTRPCDQGDQSLAAGLNAAVVIGMGQQASVLTLQNISSQADFSASDFSDGVTRLQQFTDTMGLQLQMAQGIADDDSFAQTQLKLLADSQTQQDTAVKSLANIQSAADAQGAAQDLTDLLASFLASTNNAQDGAEQALIDCFLPLTTVSG